MANPLGPSAFGAARATSARPSLAPNNAGPDTWFQDCTSPASRDGTELRSAFLNALLAQLREVIRAGGAPEDNSDEMLLRAIRSQRSNFAAASAVGGSANAITLTFDPPFAALADLIGVPLRFLVEANSTGAVTISVDGLPATSLNFVNGDPVAAGGLVTGRFVEIVYDGVKFVALAGVTAASGHTHPMADIIGLLAALDGKVSKAGDIMAGNLFAPEFRFGAALGTNSQGRLAVDSNVLVLEAFSASTGATKRDIGLASYGGRVAIGHTSPVERLDVAGNGIFTGFQPYLDLADSNAGFVKARIQSVAGAAVVSTHDPVSGLTPRAFFTADGLVGIGSASPLERLDVNGNIRAAGSLISADGIRVSNWFGTPDRVLTGGQPAQYRTLSDLGIRAKVHAAYENRFGSVGVSTNWTDATNAGKQRGCTVTLSDNSGNAIATVSFPDAGTADYAIDGLDGLAISSRTATGFVATIGGLPTNINLSFSILV